MGDLPKHITCPDCIDFFSAVDTSEPISRAWANEVHWSHRPLHPNEVGANHRRSARMAYDEWESHSPYRDDTDG